MNRILVPLDGSELAERAIGLAEAFARAFAGHIELIHVLEDPVALNLLPSLVIPDRFAAERYLRRMSDTVDDGLAVSTRVVRGHPVEEILTSTENDPESMIVMSTHGRSGLGRLMLGSVADKVLRGASVPVALMRGSTPFRRQQFHSLLVPLDKSSYSETALPLATDIARQTGATLGLVHVCEPFWLSPYVAAAPELMYMDEAQISEFERECLASARNYLDRLAGDLRPQGIRVVWEVRFGKPADETLRAADTTEADLIVMATHDRGGVRRFALGSVTNEVLHRGTTPVLAIPPHVFEHQQAAVAEMLSTL